VEYFQGLNEIAAPIFLVYLSSCFGALSDYNEEYHFIHCPLWKNGLTLPHRYLKNISVKLKMKEDIAMVEADTYWSVVAVMDKLRQRHAFTGTFTSLILEVTLSLLHCR